jgi:hypothetical protein
LRGPAATAQAPEAGDAATPEDAAEQDEQDDRDDDPAEATASLTARDRDRDAPATTASATAQDVGQATATATLTASIFDLIEAGVSLPFHRLGVPSEHISAGQHTRAAVQAISQATARTLQRHAPVPSACPYALGPSAIAVTQDAAAHRLASDARTVERTDADSTKSVESRF